MSMPAPRCRHGGQDGVDQFGAAGDAVRPPSVLVGRRALGRGPRFGIPSCRYHHSENQRNRYFGSGAWLGRRNQVPGFPARSRPRGATAVQVTGVGTAPGAGDPGCRRDPGRPRRRAAGKVDAGVAARRGTVARLSSRITTPLLPDDYLHLLNPLWSARELRGRVVEVVPETERRRDPGDQPGLGLVASGTGRASTSASACRSRAAGTGGRTR